MRVSSIVTVLEAAETNDLTVLDTLKEELEVTDTTQDGRLTRWIHEASAEIARWVGRTLGRETVSEAFYVDWHYNGPLRLARYPVAYVTSVTAAGRLLTTDDYTLDARRGTLHRTSGTSRGYWPHGNTTVVYQAGYTLLDELPEDLERACLRLIQYRHAGHGRDPMIRTESIGTRYSVGYWVGGVPGAGEDLPPDVCSLLQPYKDFAV